MGRVPNHTLPSSQLDKCTADWRQGTWAVRFSGVPDAKHSHCRPSNAWRRHIWVWHWISFLPQAIQIRVDLFRAKWSELDGPNLFVPKWHWTEMNVRVCDIVRIVNSDTLCQRCKTHFSSRATQRKIYSQTCQVKSWCNNYVRITTTSNCFLCFTTILSSNTGQLWILRCNSNRHHNCFKL